MFSKAFLYLSFLSQAVPLVHGQQALLPRPNGTYTVGLSITDMTDEKHLQPFAPVAKPRALAVSAFYPVGSSNLVPAQYMPPETARLEDMEHSQVYQLAAPNGTFERLALQLASNNSQISSAPEGGKWPVFLFNGAQGTTRLFYNSIASQVASNGYVVVTFDTAYDTDIVQYLDGTIVTANTSIQETVADAVTAVNARAQDASFVLDQLSDASNAKSLIPGCNECLNTSHVGMFGLSLGGATAATVMLNDTRFAGGVNFDGALWGDVVERGFDRPFMLMTTEGQTRATLNQPDNPDSSWFDIWPKITGPKFDFVLANSEHYTYSDLPIVLETLNITPNASTMKLEQITNLNGARALHIVTTYTTTFFDFVIRGKSPAFLQGPSPLFPEISVDNTQENITSSSTSTGSTSSATASGSENSSARSMQARTSAVWDLVLIGLLILATQIW